jgi:hypothetical protein
MKKEDTLIINHVDLILLEQQRHALHRLFNKLRDLEPHLIAYDEFQALAGILNMLDDWSDEKWHASGGKI